MMGNLLDESDDDMFAELDLLIDDEESKPEIKVDAKTIVKTDVKSATSVEVKTVEKEIKVPEKSNEKDKLKRMKKELKEVNNKHKKEIEAQKEEAEQLEQEKQEAKVKQEAEKKAKYVYFDVQNLDDRKKLSEYMKEGRIPVDTKNRPFIASKQERALFNPGQGPVHLFYCDEVINVTIGTYWFDLELMPKGSRTKAKKLINVYHKGHSTFSYIEEDQLQYLLDNNFINKNQITYWHYDMTSGNHYFMGQDSSEPDAKRLEEIKNKKLSEAEPVTINDAEKNVDDKDED
jgi:hypothetical protein